MEIMFSIILVLILFYFILVFPMQRQNRKVKRMQANLAEGDEVITIGGLVGKVTEVGDELISLEISPGVAVTVLKTAVSRRLEPQV